MKTFIFTLVVFVFCFTADAQPESDFTIVTPVAYDTNYWLHGSHVPVQVLIVEVVNTKGDLIKVVYRPKTDGTRGGKTDFVKPKELNSKTIWKIKPRNPTEEEKILCTTDNFLKSSGKINLSKDGEPFLRFRSTQFDGFIQFNNFQKMRCVVLDSNFPPETHESS